MAIIFFFSARPTDAVPLEGISRLLLLKSFHLIEYGILFLLLFFANRNIKKSIIIAYLYALTDELHQSFTPGRSPRVLDTFIDLLGILISAFFLKKFYRS